MICYSWAEIEGFSKFGSYIGNGNADGPFVYTGGKPAFVLIKNISNTQSWNIYDSSRSSTNPILLRILANTDSIEETRATTDSCDFLSNGFKIRSDQSIINTNGDAYIYACWMESPFQTANSK
jgi:hypothetical protein